MTTMAQARDKLGMLMFQLVDTSNPDGSLTCFQALLNAKSALNVTDDGLLRVLTLQAENADLDAGLPFQMRAVALQYGRDQRSIGPPGLRKFTIDGALIVQIFVQAGREGQLCRRDEGAS